jgi:hypothetical protein
VTSKLERSGLGLLKYYPIIFIERTRNYEKSQLRIARVSGRDSKGAPLEHKYEELVSGIFLPQSMNEWIK